MKRFLSLIIASMLILGMIPIVASAAETPYAEAFIKGSKGVATMDTYEKSGYNWKYKSMGGTLATQYAENDAFARLKSQGLHIQAAGWIALDIRIPEPGIYSITFDVLLAGSYKKGAMYLLPGDAEESEYLSDAYKLVDINYYTKETTAYYTDIPCNKLIYAEDANQEFTLVIQSTGPICPRSYYLEKLDEQDVTFSADASILSVGDTTETTFSIDGKTFCGATEVSYESSAPAVASVSADGKITALSTGESTITATTGNISASTKVSVVEYFNFRNDDTFVISNKGIADFTTYESTGRNWRYHNMSEEMYNDYLTNYAIARTSTYGFQLQPRQVDQFLQLELDVKSAGLYTVFFEHLTSASGSKTPAKIFLAPQDADSYISNSSYIGSALMYSAETTYDVKDELSAIYLPKAGKYIFTIQMDGTAYPSSISFSDLDDAEVSVNLSGDRTMKVGEENDLSATIMVDGTEKNIAGIKWTSTNESVATVKNGIVTALSDGDTIIKATAGELTATLPLTVTHPNGRVEEATTAKVYITATDGASLENVLGTTAESQLDIPVNTAVSATAPKTVGDKEFKYWKNLSTGSVYSVDNKIDFNVVSNIALMAVYAEKTNGYLVEFANANREIISSGYFASGASVTAPALPSLTGYGKAKGWSAYPEVVGSSDIQAVAEYDAPKEVSITVVNGSADASSYNYNDKVTVTADAAPEGQVFSHWTRGSQIVSYSPEYSFFAWSDATLTANYASSAPSAFPTVILDDAVRDDGNADAYMMETVGFEGKQILEKGILFGGSGLTVSDGTVYKAASVSGAKQFTAMVPDTSFEITAVRAYVVYNDNGVIRIAYSAEK